ncbi:MAG TPA: hydroxymethylglutaryl-CoA lyase [Mycobacteriales bacterium]|nr:hydroxymethylglutaryl-CoA lyase [Mycobacteriales bacterium]
MPSAADVQIVEVGPRDGLQSDAVTFSVEQKVAFAREVALAGLRRVEVASFVNPKRVPQMAGAEDVLAGIARLRDSEGLDIAPIGLVLNARGWDRAAATDVAEINLVVAASEGFAQHNSGMSSDDTLAVVDQVAPLAAAAGVRTSVTVSVAFGCPYDGEVPVGRVTAVAERCAAAGIDELAIADTIGVGVPADVRARLRAVRQTIGPKVALRAHFHNTRNTGYANALAALEEGASALDASLGGIGGCPFAPKATGNIATEDLAFMLERSGVNTGVDLDRLLAAAGWLETQLGRPVPSLVSKAGLFPAA